jgi:tol-pal system protein YbgF
VKTSTKLLLVSFMGLALLAPSAYPQQTKDQLNSLMTDSINLKNSVIKLQESSDQKNAEIVKLLNETLSRFAAIESSVQKLSESLTTTMKANDDKQARDLQATREALDALKKNLDDGMVSMSGQLRGLERQIANTKQEIPLPAAADVFNRAYSQLTQGFYDDAISEFREFIKNHTDPVRVPAAQFYIGQAYFDQRKFDQAVDQFDMLLQKYPSSDRKCLALYRKGQALVGLNDIPKAQAALSMVSTECPNTQEATNALGILKSLPRSGRGN